MPPATEMIELVRRHIRLWKTASHADWRACFTSDYTIEDPVGTGPRLMGSYEAEWNNMHAEGLRLDMEPYRMIPGGREIVTDLRAVTHLEEPGLGPDLEGGARSTLSYTGIYTVDDDGLLCANRTFADPVSDALWQAFYPTLPPPSERPPPPRDDLQIRQAVEDHLYFWNLRSREEWRSRFSRDAQVEDPVGTPPCPLGDARERWEAAHADGRRVRLGCNRLIVCGMEALAHTVAFEEVAGRLPRTRSNVEIFAFDAEGRIKSWRVFREELEAEAEIGSPAVR
jgi:hypothetical protein